MSNDVYLSKIQNLGESISLVWEHLKPFRGRDEKTEEAEKLVLELHKLLDQMIWDFSFSDDLNSEDNKELFEIILTTSREFSRLTSVTKQNYTFYNGLIFWRSFTPLRNYLRNNKKKSDLTNRVKNLIKVSDLYLFDWYHKTYQLGKGSIDTQEEFEENLLNNDDDDSIISCVSFFLSDEIDYAYSLDDVLDLSIDNKDTGLKKWFEFLVKYLRKYIDRPYQSIFELNISLSSTYYNNDALQFSYGFEGEGIELTVAYFFLVKLSYKCDLNNNLFYQELKTKYLQKIIKSSIKKQNSLRNYEIKYFGDDVTIGVDASVLKVCFLLSISNEEKQIKSFIKSIYNKYPKINNQILTIFENFKYKDFLKEKIENRND